MAQKNRSMAVKAAKAQTQRCEAGTQALYKRLAYAKPSCDHVTLVSVLARQCDTASVGGKDIHKCDDIKARKSARQTIRSVHW